VAGAIFGEAKRPLTDLAKRPFIEILCRDLARRPLTEILYRDPVKRTEILLRHFFIESLNRHLA